MTDAMAAVSTTAPGTAPAAPAAWEPVRAALLAQAGAEADRIRAQAQAEASRLLDRAAAEAAGLLAQARADGEADTARLVALGRARTRRAARGARLVAQREIYETLRARCCAAVTDLLADPERRRQLGDAVEVRYGAAPAAQRWSGRDLVAELPDGRSVDASVPALVDAALATLDLERLWTR